GFGQRDADAEHGSASVRQDASRQEYGTIDDAAPMPDFLVACIEDDIGRPSQGALSPGLKLFVEQLRRSTDLSTGNLQSAELLSHFHDFPRGNALDIHLGNGKLQGALASLATFEGRRIEFDVSRLRNAEMKFSEPAVDDFGFE